MIFRYSKRETNLRNGGGSFFRTSTYRLNQNSLNSNQNPSYFDNQIIILGIILLIIWLLINFLLGKTLFKENNWIKKLLSLIVAALITYGLYDSGYLRNLTLDSSSIQTYLPLILATILAILFIYSIYSFGLAKTLIGFGIFFILLSQTPLIYEKGIVLLIGIILFILGFLLLLVVRKFRKKSNILKGQTGKDKTTLYNDGRILKRSYSSGSNNKEGDLRIDLKNSLTFRKGENQKIIKMKNIGDKPIQWSIYVYPKNWLTLSSSGNINKRGTRYGGTLPPRSEILISLLLNRKAHNRVKNKMKEGAIIAWRGKGARIKVRSKVYVE